MINKASVCFRNMTKLSLPTKIKTEEYSSVSQTLLWEHFKVNNCSIIQKKHQVS